MVSPTSVRRNATYVSRFAPRYSVPLHFKGLTIPTVMKYSGLATGFGVSLGLFAVFFFGEVPRVREDILMKVPVIGNYWERSIPEQDNPF